jgi:hypothetical protein
LKEEGERTTMKGHDDKIVKLEAEEGVIVTWE